MVLDVLDTLKPRDSKLAKSRRLRLDNAIFCERRTSILKSSVKIASYAPIVQSTQIMDIDQGGSTKPSYPRRFAKPTTEKQTSTKPLGQEYKALEEDCGVTWE